MGWPPQALLSPLRRGPLEILTGRWTLDYSPVFAAFDIAARLLSPYDVNPLDSINMLSPITCCAGSPTCKWPPRTHEHILRHT